MLKLTKEDKMIILSLILIICMVIVFVALELSQNIFAKFDTTPTIEKDNSLEDLYNNILSSSKNTESPIIRECLYDIFELINNKEYSKLYTHLTDDIKNYYFYTEESFITYMNKNFSEKTYSPNFSKYKKIGRNIYVVNVSFLPKQITNETLVENQVAEKYDVFTLFLDDTKNYKFSFRNFIASCSPNTKKGNEEIAVTLKKVDLYNSETKFTVNITNNTDTDIFIPHEKIFCQLGIRPVYYPSTVWIPKNSDTDIEFTIYAGISLKSSLPINIAFSEIMTKDTVYMLNLPIKYPIELN